MLKCVWTHPKQVNNQSTARGSLDLRKSHFFSIENVSSVLFVAFHCVSMCDCLIQTFCRAISLLQCKIMLMDAVYICFCVFYGDHSHLKICVKFICPCISGFHVILLKAHFVVKRSLRQIQKFLCYFRAKTRSRFRGGPMGNVDWS